MTATMRLYSQWLQADNKKDKADFEGQLAAICIAACRTARIAPPYEKKKDDSGRTFWSGGSRALSPWVYRWVSDELGREARPLKDGARFIGRRCVCALIDEIRWQQRRKRNAQMRDRSRNTPAEIDRLRSEMIRELSASGLPDRLRIPRDRELLRRLMAVYPLKLSNVSIAREEHVSEGAIRKRRNRIGASCFRMADGHYQLRCILADLGLKEGYENRP